MLFCVLLAACAARVFVFVYFSKPDSIGEKYRKVRVGMAQKAVEEILGPPTDEEQTGSMGGVHCCTWEEDGNRISVSYHTDQRTGAQTVREIRITPEMPLETLRRWSKGSPLAP